MKKKLKPKLLSRSKKAEALEPLRRRLKKCTKDELIEVVIEFARASRKTQRELENRFGVEPTKDALIADTRQAIREATDFDERQANYNFEYDYGAYQTVERNFRRMVEAGQLEQVMELALELMKLGSYQVEMSDEGMMTEEIQQCLRPAIQAVQRNNRPFPPAKIAEWAQAMLAADRVGFICDKELRQLCERV